MIQPVAIIGLGQPDRIQTAWLREFAERHRMIYISPDEMICDLSTELPRMQRQQKLWHDICSRIGAAIGSGAGVVVNATHLTSSDRVELIRACRASQALLVKAIWFPADRSHQIVYGPPPTVPEYDRVWSLGPLAQHAQAS